MALQPISAASPISARGNVESSAKYTLTAPAVARKLTRLAIGAIAIIGLSSLQTVKAGIVCFTLCMSTCTAATGGALAPACVAACVSACAWHPV